MAGTALALLAHVVAPVHRSKRRPARSLGLCLLLIGIGGLACYLALREPPTTKQASSAMEGSATTFTPPKRLVARHAQDRAAAAVKSGSASGWIIDGQGVAIDSVSIHRINAEGGPGDSLATTDMSGSFQFVDAPEEGEELLLLGDAVFASTFRYGSQKKGMRILATRRMSLGAKVSLTGKAASGVQVELQDGSGEAARVLISDAEGLVQFDDLPVGNYELWAHGEYKASQVLRVSRLRPEEEVLELALEPAAQARGRIVDAEGQGVAARLVVLPENAEYAAIQLESEADGSFALDALLPGRWQVEAQADGYVTAKAKFLEVDSNALDFDVKLEKGGTVWGRVVDHEGVAVANARVVVASEQSSTKTALRQDSTSKETIRWVHPLATKRELPGHHSRRFGAGRDGARPTECGRGHCGVDLGSQRGRVVHAAAEARVAKVARESVGKAGRYVVLEHSGGLKSFYMHLDEIHADLEVGQGVHAGEAIATIGRTGVIRSGPHLHFAISQSHGERTWFIDPEPILQHAVVLSSPQEMRTMYLAADSIRSTLLADVGGARDKSPPAASSGGVLRSDSEGRFRLAGLGAGSYTASAYHDDLAPGSSARFAVAHGRESGEIMVRLEPGVAVYGYVHGPSGPIAGALVEAEESGELVSRVVAKAYTDASGRYELRPLRARVTLRSSAAGYGEVERSIALVGGVKSRGEREEVFDLSARDRQLEAQVLDTAGFPIRGASVRIVSGPSSRGRRATTDESGYFLMSEMAAGSYQVDVLSEEFPKASATLSTEGKQEIRVRPGSKIYYRVSDTHTREALAGVRVQASGPGDQRSSAITNADGEAVFPSLPAGLWTLRVQKAGYVAHEERVDLKAGEQALASREEHSAELSRGATLAGTLRDHNGDRVGSARIWVGASSTHSDQDGRFRLVDVASGAIRLQAESGEASAMLEMELHPGDEFVTLDLRLR